MRGLERVSEEWQGRRRAVGTDRRGPVWQAWIDRVRWGAEWHG